MPEQERSSVAMDRRTLLRLGGTTITLAAVVAACAPQDEGAGPEGVAAAGVRPPLASPPSGQVDDVVLLRTATSLHYNAMDVVDIVSNTDGVDPAVVSLGTAYKGLLQQQADALAEATAAAGGEAYEMANPVIHERIIDPAVALLDVSDVKGRDAGNLLHAVATLAEATHHAFVDQLSEPALRQAAMSIGLIHAQVSAALAHVISPENIVSADEIAAAEPAGIVEAGTTTSIATGVPAPPVADLGESADVEAPVSTETAVYMVPSAFGQLSAVQVTLGKAGAEDETKRQTLNIETPSLNSMVY